MLLASFSDVTVTEAPHRHKRSSQALFAPLTPQGCVPRHLVQNCFVRALYRKSCHFIISFHVSSAPHHKQKAVLLVDLDTRRVWGHTPPGDSSGHSECGKCKLSFTVIVCRVQVGCISHERLPKKRLRHRVTAVCTHPLLACLVLSDQV